MQGGFFKHTVKFVMSNYTQFLSIFKRGVVTAPTQYAVNLIKPTELSNVNYCFLK